MISTSAPHIRPASRSGRKSSLTPMVARVLIKSFRTGATMVEASTQAGVGERTLRRWLARGQTEDTGPYRALLLACQQACAAYDQKLTHAMGIADLDELVGAVSPEVE